MAKARNYSRTVALEGNLPITPHIYFTQFLDENVAEERALGIKMGIELMKECDRMYVYGEKFSKGMLEEIDWWRLHKRREDIYYHKEDYTWGDFKREAESMGYEPEQESQLEVKFNPSKEK